MKRCFTSAQAIVPRSKRLKAIGLKQTKDGNLSGKSESGIEFKLTYLKGIGLVLTEESFVDLALMREWSFAEMSKRITRKVTVRSRKLYKQKYL
jgi:hypothetical protein